MIAVINIWIKSFTVAHYAYDTEVLGCSIDYLLVLLALTILFFQTVYSAIEAILLFFFSQLLTAHAVILFRITWELWCLPSEQEIQT